MGRPITPGAALLLASVALAACGGDEPPAVSGPAEEAADLVTELERATVARDFKRVCDELFAAQARRQAGGDECAGLLRRTTADLEDPRIVIESVALRERGASVRVTTTAKGQAEVGETIDLVRERGELRIAALGT